MGQINAGEHGSTPSQSMGAELFVSLMRTQTLTMGFLGFILAIVGFVFPSFTPIPAGWLVVAIVVSLMVIWIFADALNRSLQNSSTTLPKVVTALKSNGVTLDPVLVLSPSDLFGFRSLVTVYYTDVRGIELEVGSGLVSAIQTDKKIQIQLTAWSNDYRDKLSSALNCDASVLGNLLVKPSSTYSQHDTPFPPIYVPPAAAEEATESDGVNDE